MQRLSRMGIKGAALMAFNTDSKHLNTLDSGIKRSLIGGPLTRGMGAGGFPEMGMKAAEYSRSDIEAAPFIPILLSLCTVLLPPPPTPATAMFALKKSSLP